MHPVQLDGVSAVPRIAHLDSTNITVHDQNTGIIAKTITRAIASISWIQHQSHSACLATTTATTSTTATTAPVIFYCNTSALKGWNVRIDGCTAQRLEDSTGTTGTISVHRKGIFADVLSSNAINSHFYNQSVFTRISRLIGTNFPCACCT